jgi:adenosylcobinamide-GDP ribazoletransferase
MKKFCWQEICQWWKKLNSSFLAALTFYTTIPIPQSCILEFDRVARWAPAIGLLIGGLLGLGDWFLSELTMPSLTRAVLIVSLWLGITGGLHLDGAIDTADGLAVFDRAKRLEVMKDSVTGAFGVMAAGVLLLLKTAALNDLHSWRWLGLMLSAGWGRWGQLCAIAFYPYLKPTGKGAFHKQAIRPAFDILFGLLFLLGLNFFAIVFDRSILWLVMLISLFCLAIALIVGFWFYRALGGHTGDTYGAVVEWTEALILCLLTCLCA